MNFHRKTKINGGKVRRRVESRSLMNGRRILIVMLFVFGTRRKTRTRKRKRSEENKWSNPNVKYRLFASPYDLYKIFVLHIHTRAHLPNRKSLTLTLTAIIERKIESKSNQRFLFLPHSHYSFSSSISFGSFCLCAWLKSETVHKKRNQSKIITKKYTWRACCWRAQVPWSEGIYGTLFKIDVKFLDGAQMLSNAGMVCVQFRKKSKAIRESQFFCPFPSSWWITEQTKIVKYILICEQ